MAITREELQAGMSTVMAVAEVVRDAGRVPAGVVYMALMTRGVTFEGYEKIIGILERSKLIRRDGDVLVWII